MRGSLVDRVLQALAGRKFRALRRRNIERLAGAWIAALARGPLGHQERAESDQTYIVTSLQRGGDLVEHFIDRFRRVGLRQARAGGNRSHEVVLIHLSSPFEME